MANPFVKSWKYLMAAFGAKVDEKADPKIQIQQAIAEAQRQHQALSQQAAQVIGNQRQLEMQLNRSVNEVASYQNNARQALTLADKARSEGDAEKTKKYEDTAQTFASQLVSAEQQLENLKRLHQQSGQAADQARRAVEQNASMLKQKISERTKLLSQLEQAKMQEKVSASLQQVSQMAAPGNVPTLSDVQEKIERRYATALGQAELASNSVEGRMLEVEKSSIDMAGSARLEQIRASMSGGPSGQQAVAGSAGASGAEAIEGGGPAGTADAQPVSADAAKARLEELTQQARQEPSTAKPDAG